MPARRIFDVLLDPRATAPRCLLEEEYGAALVIGAGRVAVNFVSSIDGVVSFGLGAEDSRAVGGGVIGDRTLMAMLRAVAGVIVVGAGTLRATLNHQWTPEAVLPERAADLSALRSAAGLSAAPAPLLVVAGGHDIPAEAAAVSEPAVPIHVVTGPPGARPAVDDILAAAGVISPGPVLCEGGPHLFGSLLDAGVPVDLFVTVAPQVAGATQGSQRQHLVEGVALDPFQRRASLVSVRRSADHLLLRYEVDAAV